MPGDKVFLVGAGPGDPDLITLKGREALSRADLVLYDHLANEALLDFAPPAAERIYVGKKKAEHAVEQPEIIALMIDRARHGMTVVRLKGGDPFIFGRGGEEAEALGEAGVPFEVIPGVTAPLGIASYCGVPLTHREHTSVVTMITGHQPEQIDWAKVSGSETVVIYMGLTHLGEIARRMIEAGRPESTPAIAVRWGTRPEQHSVRGTLGDLARLVAEAELKPPATVIVGEVVRLSGRLGWYEKLPLFGQRVVVTRAGAQSAEMAAALRTLGAEPVLVPVIAMEPGDRAAMDRAVAELAAYDWVVFTSANGVRFFLERLDASLADVRSLRGRVAAIGPATAACLKELHLKVDLMPREFVAESVVEAFTGVDLDGKRVLLPRAAAARDTLPEALRARGARVDVVAAYRTIIPAGAAERARLAFARRPDWVTFTSSSTVKNLLAVIGHAALEGVKIATIGPVTSDTARRHGLAVSVEAEPYTVDGLIRKMMERPGTDNAIRS